MKLTPENIKSQEFSKSLRGYNTEEVKAYLEKLATEFEDSLNENEQIKEEIKNVSERVTEFIKMEKICRILWLKLKNPHPDHLNHHKNNLN